MFGRNTDKEKLDLVLDLYARAVNTLELQESFLSLLGDLLKEHNLTDKINPKTVEDMWVAIKHQVDGAKQVFASEGKPYPPK